MFFKRLFKSKKSASKSRPTSTVDPGVGNAKTAAATTTDYSIHRGVYIPSVSASSIATSNISKPSAVPSPSPVVKQQPVLSSTACEAAKFGLALVKESADAFGPLKSVAGGLSFLLTQYEQFISNKEDVRRIISRIDSLLPSLTGTLPSDDSKETQRRTKLRRKLITVLETLELIKQQGRTTRFLRGNEQAGTISGIIEDIRDAITDYQTALQQDIYDKNCLLIDTADLHLLSQLNHAAGAGYFSGDREKCLSGTRTKVLLEIERWAEDVNNGRVYWLNGAAGSGKTTIAQTFAERAFAEDRLGGSFFCSRVFTERSNLHLIFPTLALHLAYKFPSFRVHLVKIIRSRPDVGRESLSVQLEKLLIDPLKATKLSTIIIIDALDECKDEESASVILSLLSRHIDDIPFVKFFITGRPEPRIRTGFRLPLLRPHTEIFVLHDVDPEFVDHDIRIFLKTRLGELAKNRSGVNVAGIWPDDDDIDILVRKSAGLFIVAFTTWKFIASGHQKLQERLELITRMPDGDGNQGLTGIDPVYTQVFDDGYADVGSNSFGIFDRLRLILGSIVLLFNPLSRAQLAILLEEDSESIWTSLRSLHSLLQIPDSESEPIRLFHTSFHDYLTDHKRCKNPNFHVDRSVYHAKLAIRCLELMQGRLKKNICSMPPFAMNKDVVDLPTRRKQCIGEPIEYACRFWAKHLGLASHSGNDCDRLIKLLREFMKDWLLLWLEALSITDHLRGAVHSLDEATKWLVKTAAPDPNLLKFMTDGERFIQTFFDVIQESAPHVYRSALPWTPTASLIRRHNQHNLNMEVKVLNGLGSYWDSCNRVIETRGYVTAIAFSHSGSLIAGSGEFKGFLQIFEVATGACLATLTEDGDRMNSIAFSPDDNFLVSGCGNSTVEVWDVKTGGLARRLMGHKKAVNSVTFSPNGRNIASASSDDAIRIWNLETGQCDGILKGDSSPSALYWSKAGRRLVSGLMNGMVMIWDPSTKACSRSFRAHTDRIWSVASSADFSKIVSGSEDKTMKVHDTKTNAVLTTVSAEYPVLSVSFLPEGDRVVYTSGSYVYIWDLTREVNVSVFGESLHSVKSLAVSPDGATIASGSDDSLTLWQSGPASTSSADEVENHSGPAHCISFAGDGRLIATGSYDGTVKLWDPTSGSCKHTFHGHFGRVKAVAVSPDSSCIVSVTPDSETLSIWDVDNLRLIRTIEKTQAVAFVRFSPDSSQIVCLSDDPYSREASETASLWDDHPSGVHQPGAPRNNLTCSQVIRVFSVETGDAVAGLHLGPRVDPMRTIFFTSTGTSIISQSSQGMLMKWAIRDAASNSSIAAGATQYPYVLNYTSDDEATMARDLPPEPYNSDFTDWILDKQGRKVCWVPVGCRGCSNSNAERLALLGSDGKVTILDFSNVHY